MGKNIYRVLLTNNIELYARLTDVKLYQNILEPFCAKMHCEFKCKRKNWFLFYSFLWTCRETAKSKALEIVYRAYDGALKGW